MNILKWVLVSIASLVIVAFASNSVLVASVEDSMEGSEQFRDGKFRNRVEKEESVMKVLTGVIKRGITETRIDARPEALLPMQTVTADQLQALSDDTTHIIKLGHSSLLLKLYGEYWLIDPVFSERASPFSVTGPARFQPTPIGIEELPPIDKVFISHNHYDHLDKKAIEFLASTTRQFLVPLGVEGDLQRWGVAKNNITSFDWWQELQTRNALVAFTPAHHFSGRGLTDRNTTLWGSWVIHVADQRLFYSGDSGYFDGFADIGNKYGPFDLTMIEVGAYDSLWPDVHMSPEQAVQAHIDLQGKTMMSVHNSTFDLASHAWYEPLERVSAAAEKKQVALTTPIFGEVLTADQPAITTKWWQ